MRKKLLTFWVITALFTLLGITAAAETSDYLGVEITLNPTGIILDNKVDLSLYAEDGSTCLGTTEAVIDRFSEKIQADFHIAPYELGECFQLRLDSGLRSLEYNYRSAPEGGVIFLPTGISEDGSHINYFAVNAVPYCEKKVNIFVDGKLVPLDPQARLIDGVTMVPVIGMAKAIGVANNTYWQDSQSVEISIGDRKEVFSAGYYSIIYNGTEYTMPQPTMILDSGAIYVPLRDMAEGFDSVITLYTPDENTYDINVSYSPVAKKVEEEAARAARIAEQGKTANLVNTRGIASQTNYMIWVSKSEYLVRVYKGSKGNWELINSFQCAIGAPSTPTCTGEYRYYSKEKAWRYANYYCGPIMRFNGGYAIHSTLRRYDGSDYDGRVGVAISHGCVRVRPSNIDWLVNTVPLYSKIYITN